MDDGQVRPAQGVGVGLLLQGETGLDGQHELGQLPGRERQVLGAPLADQGQHPGDALDRPGVQGRVAAVELGIAGGVDPELGDQQPPARRGALGALGQVEQGGEVPGAGQVPGQRRVLPGAFGDPVLEQGQEQIGLAGEARVHHALGEPGLVGDLLQGGGVVAPGQEYPAGGGGRHHDPFGVKKKPGRGGGQGRVRTSGPSAVTATVCSEWAARLPSPLRMVQPSRSM